MIKAPTGLVQRAYMVSEYCEPRHVLIDSYGMVFDRIGIGGGWSNKQGDKYSRYIPIGEPVPMWDSNEIWDSWWMPKAWNIKSWAWMYSEKEDDSFNFLYRSSLEDRKKERMLSYFTKRQQKVKMKLVSRGLV